MRLRPWVVYKDEVKEGVGRTPAIGASTCRSRVSVRIGAERGDGSGRTQGLR
ncbi:hypothetical protein BN903_157 [Halorubrum sp. AJ67]|nr:hypothetical protein BN903_157 [Halorubrum sp. AJ67]